MARAATMSSSARQRPDHWPERLEITETKAVLMLSDMRALAYLTPFMNTAHTLSSAAAALNRSTSTLAYWIPRFVKVGLLVHLGDRKRAGMAMPTYRTPATQLVVPFRSLPFDRRVALLDGGRIRVLRRFLDGLDEEIEHDPGLALGFSSEAPNSFAVEMVETGDHRQVRGYTDGWMILRLTPADATQLAQEMEALFDKYAKRHGPKRYIAHRGIATDPRHRWRSADDDLPL